VSGRGFIAVEPPGTCETCGKRAELRPYGPNGARVCFDCGMKPDNRANLTRRTAEYLGLSAPTRRRR
jgi:hypothetical protein